MQVYTKLHRFESVFEHDPYIEVWADGNDRKFIIAQREGTQMYRKQLMAWVFLSQALQPNVDEAIFHRSTSPGRCWEETVDWYEHKDP